MTPLGKFLSTTAPRNLQTFNDVSHYEDNVVQAIAPMSVEGGPRGFVGALHANHLGASGLYSIHTSQHIITRTPHHISSGRRDALKFALQLSGTQTIIQDGREATLHPGDISFYDADIPYSLATSNDSWSVVFLAPRGNIGIRSDYIAQLTAVRLPEENPLTNVIGGFLKHLNSTADRIPTFDGTKLAHNAMDLLSTLLTSELGSLKDAEANKDAQLLDDVHAFIEQQLHNPELDPSLIAKAVFISVRSLHAIFQTQGQSVSSWIKSRRLDQAKADLANEQLFHLPVAAIAARWGMLNAPHFSRSFKEVFGESPTRFRRRVKHGG